MRKIQVTLVQQQAIRELLMLLVNQVMIRIHMINVLIQAQMNVNNSNFFLYWLNILYSIDCSYPGSRFKDEVTDYYYGDNDNRKQPQFIPTPKSSFQNHAQTLNEHYDRNHNTRHKGNINMYSSVRFGSGPARSSRVLPRSGRVQLCSGQRKSDPCRTLNAFYFIKICSFCFL
jgi:hypothetical protein